MSASKCELRSKRIQTELQICLSDKHSLCSFPRHKTPENKTLKYRGQSRALTKAIWLSQRGKKNVGWRRRSVYFCSSNMKAHLTKGSLRLYSPSHSVMRHQIVHPFHAHVNVGYNTCQKKCVWHRAAEVLTASHIAHFHPTHDITAEVFPFYFYVFYFFLSHLF